MSISTQCIISATSLHIIICISTGTAKLQTIAETKILDEVNFGKSKG